ATRTRPSPPLPQARRGIDAFLADRLSGLPDADAFLGWEVEVVVLGYVEGVVPGIEVAHGERAEIARGVPVGGDALAQCRVAELGGPSLSIGDEEALISGEAVDH